RQRRRSLDCANLRRPRFLQAAARAARSRLPCRSRERHQGELREGVTETHRANYFLYPGRGYSPGRDASSGHCHRRDGISSSIPHFNKLGYFLPGLAASGMLFSICILTIALVFALLADPIARLFGKPLDQSLWPNDLDNVGSELWTIVPPIFVCLMMAVSLLVAYVSTPTRS